MSHCCNNENKTFKRKVWNFKLANFERYREILADYNLEEKVNLSTDMDENINPISEAIMSAAEQAIPNKVATIREKLDSLLSIEKTDMKLFWKTS